MTRSTRATPLLVCALALAVWFASTLAFVHRSLHLHQYAASVSAVSAVSASSAVDVSAVSAPHKSHGSGLEALFGSHTDADCRLYDQLANGSAAPSVPLLVLPIAMPMAQFHYFLGEAIARWVVLFDARGPPASR